MKGKFKLLLMTFLLVFALVACNNATTAATTVATTTAGTTAVTTTTAPATTTQAPTTTAPATTTQAATTIPPTTTEEVTTTTTESPYLFDYDWVSDEWNGEQAFADGEGDNFMIMDGYANTINNLGVIGPTSVWSFGYTPYDMNIGESTIEAKVQYTGSTNVDENAVFSIRHLYAMHYDLQIFFENGDVYTGVKFYNSSTNVLGDSTNITKGGQLSGQQFVQGEDYVVKLIYVYTGETTTDIYVYVNDILEIYLTDVAIQSPNGKFGIGASARTGLKVDYLRAYETDPESLSTPLLSGVTLSRGWEFDDVLGTAGSTILGDSYVEGYSFAADGDGYLRSVTDALGTFGPAASWQLARTGYDMAIPTNYVLQVKVRANSVSGLGSAVAAIRPSHAIYCDFQFVMNSDAEGAGVYVYKQGAAWASASGLTYGLNTDYVVSIVFQQTSTEHATSTHGTYLISVFIDNTLVLQIENGESAGPSASIGLICSTNSDISFDYLRIYGFE